MSGLTKNASKSLATAAMVACLIGGGAAWRAALAAEASAAIPNFAPDRTTAGFRTAPPATISFRLLAGRGP